MITKRVILIIALFTLFGFITVWQQIQTTRFGYKISELEQYKKQLVEQQLGFDVQLARLKSPPYLLAQGKLPSFVYPPEWSRVSRVATGRLMVTALATGDRRVAKDTKPNCSLSIEH